MRLVTALAAEISEGRERKCRYLNVGEVTRKQPITRKQELPQLTDEKLEDDVQQPRNLTWKRKVVVNRAFDAIEEKLEDTRQRSDRSRVSDRDHRHETNHCDSERYQT